ncbi:hypothetical protein ACF0H5_007668 [Mactra antiquata]
MTDVGMLEDNLTRSMALTKYLADYMSDNESGEITSDEDDESLKKVTPKSTTDRLLFSAHFSTSLTTATSYRALIFDAVDTNCENCYNVSTGRFTAPRAGLFVFFLTITSTERLLASLCFIHKFHPVNQSKIKERKKLSDGFYIKTMAAVLDLEKDDEVWILNLTKPEDARRMCDTYYTTFAGGLIETVKSLWE